MRSSLSKESVIAYHKRWQAVNAAEKKELRLTPILKKFRQTAVLMASAPLFKTPPSDYAEIEQMRKQWTKLRKAHLKCLKQKNT